MVPPQFPSSPHTIWYRFWEDYRVMRGPLRFRTKSCSNTVSHSVTKLLPPVVHFQWVEKIHHGNHISVPRFQCPLCSNWFSLNHPLDHFKREHNLQVTSTLEIPGKFHEAVTAARKRQTLPGGKNPLKSLMYYGASPDSNAVLDMCNQPFTENDHHVSQQSRDTHKTQSSKFSPVQENAKKRPYSLASTTSKNSTSPSNFSMLEDQSYFPPSSIPMPKIVKGGNSRISVEALTQSQEHNKKGSEQSNKNNLLCAESQTTGLQKSLNSILCGETIPCFKMVQGDHTLPQRTGNRRRSCYIPYKVKEDIDEDLRSEEKYDDTTSLEENEFWRRTVLPEMLPSPEESLEPLLQSIISEVLKETDLNSIVKLLELRKNRILHESQEMKKISQLLIKKQHGLNDEHYWITHCLQRCKAYKDTLLEEVNSIKTLTNHLKALRSNLALQCSNTCHLLGLAHHLSKNQEQATSLIETDTLDAVMNDPNDMAKALIVPSTPETLSTTSTDSSALIFSESTSNSSLESPSQENFLPLGTAKTSSHQDDNQKRQAIITINNITASMKEINEAVCMRLESTVPPYHPLA